MKVKNNMKSIILILGTFILCSLSSIASVNTAEEIKKQNTEVCALSSVTNDFEFSINPMYLGESCYVVEKTTDYYIPQEIGKVQKNKNSFLLRFLGCVCSRK